MALKDGDDFNIGDQPPYQAFNRMKNAFRRAGACIASALSNPQPGMALSDSEDNRRHHVVSVGGSTIFFEILQAEVMVCMDNQIVCYDNEPVTMSVV